MSARGGRMTRILTWGLLWGVIVTVTEALAFPRGDSWTVSDLMLWAFLDWVLPIWIVVGCAYAWLAEHFQRRTELVLGWLCVSLVFAPVHAFLSIGVHVATTALLPWAEHFAAALSLPRPTLAQWKSLALYDLWAGLFYGALLIAGYTLTTRGERVRSLLNENAIARTRAEALLDQARFEALESQVDPRLLLNSMHELARRYSVSPESAERLLEALTEFLRCAMPGLRERVSNLETELRLARAYARLQVELGSASAWRIDDRLGEAAPVQFPSLLMLPLLALAGAEDRPVLKAESTQGQVLLSLCGLARQAPDDLQQQLRARLRALYGTGFGIESHSAAETQISITLETT